jgi:thioredoxin-related protein
MTRKIINALAVFVLLTATLSANAQEYTSGVSYVNDYEQAVEIEGKKILVVFGAEWCRYCQVLKNEIDMLQVDEYIVCLVDVDQRPDLKKKYLFKTLPTSVVLFNRKEIARKSGYTRQDYGGWLEKHKK